MHINTDINAIVSKAKQERADYISSKVQGAVLPVALVALVSLALVHFTDAPTGGQAQVNPVVEVGAHNG